jgi:serine/threonine protein kinase
LDILEEVSFSRQAVTVNRRLAMPKEATKKEDMLDQIMTGERNDALSDPVEDYQLIYSKEGSSPLGQNIKLKDFDIINLIGKGSISNVYLVMRKSTGEAYAMKCVQKGLILHEDLFSNTKLEKELLITVRVVVSNC